ncbi:hypothetical protein AVEN_31885-1 [Araneus ventricosus]|uniref:Uncharacterized protein n=1 Tax=Araneus ventricosus TaxID=182803 RepID=A0A4Y2U1N2_ARAVE|nr:hypothetical protein AVEN_31885-1 [Araneus ventricosus]
MYSATGDGVTVVARLATYARDTYTHDVRLFHMREVTQLLAATIHARFSPTRAFGQPERQPLTGHGLSREELLISGRLKVMCLQANPCQCLQGIVPRGNGVKLLEIVVPNRSSRYGESQGPQRQVREAGILWSRRQACGQGR